MIPPLTSHTSTQELDEGRCKVKLPIANSSPNCRFKDVALDNGRCATVLLENPVGCGLVEEGRAKEFAGKLLC